MKTKHFLLHRCTTLLLMTAIFYGCKKDFLEQKPSTKIVVPTTLADFQLLLNYSGINKVSALPLLSCDDYFIASKADWDSGSPLERNCYSWAGDTYGGMANDDNWNLPYVSVFYANSILTGLEKLQVGKDQVAYHDVKGQAYFVRAFAFMDLLRNFSAVYDRSTAGSDLGIPLKLSPNVDELVQRSSVEQSYHQVIADLSKACRLLPSAKSTVPNRASKPAAYALFAKLYLSMGDYNKAEIYADSSLRLYDKLLDYNTLDSSSHYAFLVHNPEVIFISLQNTTGFSNAVYNPYTNIGMASELMDSYSPNDLRRAVYFYRESGLYKPKRGYSATSDAPFGGLAVDELYLIKAECAARRSDVQTATDLMNKLLLNRFQSGHFTLLSGLTAPEVLKVALLERRKELVWRAGSRWDDLRRLNQQGAGINLSRRIGDVLYQLPANSSRYVFPIPQAELIQSGIAQNNRNDDSN